MMTAARNRNSKMSRIAIILAAIGAAATVSVEAQAEPLSVRSTFRVGTGGSILCSAQSLGRDRALTGMFDRGYSLVCRDAAVPIGRIYVLTVRGEDPAQRLAALRAQHAACAAPRRTAVEGLGPIDVIDCKLNDADVAFRAYQLRKGKLLYSAEGLAGYDSALRLGLRSIVADKEIPGEVSIATTGAGDAAAFARVQAGTLDASRALAEAYRRNNAGSYAESAEYFATITQGQSGASGKAEALANEALQKSNLGRYAEADTLFSRAQEVVGSNAIVARQFRNFRTMHLLNQGNPKAALEELDKPMPPAASSSDQSMNALVIDAAMAARLSAEAPASRQIGSAGASLLPQEKADILDGQALQLRGAALRLTGNTAAAADALAKADAKLTSVRGGKVTSIVWMRAQTLGDLGAVAEAGGNTAEADRLYRASVDLLQANYPGSAALLSTRGRLAGFLARNGQQAQAEVLFREIVKAQADVGTSQPTLANVLAPYVELLLKKGNDPQAVADLFETTQAMLRPGVAQTQAMLARELSGGSDDASRLFRQSVSLTRQIERARIEVARLEATAQPSAADATRLRALRLELAEAEKDQAASQARLADFPRFRALSNATISLAELQKLLRDGEGYYKLTVVGDRIYALFATPHSARAVRIEATAKQLEGEVDSLRETISTVENGRRETYAFDVGLARHLYVELFQPFDAELAGVRHLIFEPDGAMLRLPPNLLLMNDTGLDAYRKRAAAGGDAEFDFTGLQWLGRDRDISTSVSARAFREMRTAPPAAGPREYLGLGQNAVPGASLTLASASAEDRDCVLSLTSWAHPISPKELRIAGNILAANDPGGAQIVTGDAFTDTALMTRSDLSQFRIIHFATHGIVTPPQRKCPIQPALITSFGGRGSDGLLTFREIFDLRLDADLVILSACDTASQASRVATREAGLAGGGDVALDGLVRAFVGAGGRLVIASHWPVPDDFNATQRLITGLFTAPPGTPTATALRLSERQLMDDPQTSHPFYWSAFAAIGDGSAPVIRKTRVMAKLQQ
jgi:CHAT domain-containing protein